MTSRKGIAVTGVVLAAITAASFFVWYIPQSGPAVFDVGDYGEYLDGVKAIHLTLDDTVTEGFGMVADGTLSPGEYVTMAETTTSQNNAQISAMLSSKPSDEWVASYGAYIESLRAFNSYVRETIVYATLVQDGGSAVDLDEASAAAEGYRERMNDLAARSDDMRPRGQ